MARMANSDLSIWWRLYIYALHGYFSEIGECELRSCYKNQLGPIHHRSDSIVSMLSCIIHCYFMKANSLYIDLHYCSVNSF